MSEYIIPFPLPTPGTDLDQHLFSDLLLFAGWVLFYHVIMRGETDVLV